MKVYFPTRYIDVPASLPHEGTPSYRVSVGIEHWGDGSAQYVYKIQMAYNGVVAGRKSPSFPEGSDDLERVYEAMRQLKAGDGKSGRGMITAAGTDRGMSPAEAKGILREVD